MHRLGRGEKFSIRPLEEILTMCNVLIGATQPTASWISAIRLWTLSSRWCLQNITAADIAVEHYIVPSLFW